MYNPSNPAVLYLPSGSAAYLLARNLTSARRTVSNLLPRAPPISKVPSPGKSIPLPKIKAPAWRG